MHRIFQLLPTVQRGDGVGNEALAIQKLLRDRGVTTQIYAEHIGPGLPSSEVMTLRHLEELHLEKDDLILYHLSTVSKIADLLPGLPCRIMFRYHNVTPPEFNFGYQPVNARKGFDGIAQVKLLRNVPEKVICVSEFNKSHLESLGYTCPMEVIPILMDFLDYDQEPEDEMLTSLSDGRKNILFVGRVVPNKKQEDIIRSFAAYRKKYDAAARLILVGGCPETDLYHGELLEYCAALGLTSEDVYFTGSIPFRRILSCYRAADLFLCMSEHEGFCIPLLEAMHFHVPVMAYASSAIPETLGGSGMLLDTKDPFRVADKMHLLMTDEALRTELVKKQDERLQSFTYEMTARKLMEAITE